MEITVAAESAKSSYSIDGAATTVTQVRTQRRWPTRRLRRSSRRHQPADSWVSARIDEVRWRPAHAGTGRCNL